jgi:hypothetical protein
MTPVNDFRVVAQCYPQLTNIRASALSGRRRRQRKSATRLFGKNPINVARKWRELVGQ